MADREGVFTSADGRSGIAYYVWLPEGARPAGFLQLAHGMAEHGGRYERFARFMNGKGFGVAINDHIGHGKSAADGVYGHFGKDGASVMAEDAHTLNALIKKEYGGEGRMPLFLLGHSMGSFVARAYCAKYGRELDGAIFSGTSGGGAEVWQGLLAASLLKAVKGGEAPGSAIARMSLKVYNKRIPGALGGEWLSRDEAVCKGYNDDPLCGFTFSLDAYKALFRLIIDVNKKSWFGSYPKELPTFLISGLEDPVGAYGRGVLKVYTRLIDAGNGSVYIRLYEGGRHEMLNETNRDEVYEDIWAFISKICQAPS